MKIDPVRISIMDHDLAKPVRDDLLADNVLLIVFDDPKLPDKVCKIAIRFDAFEQHVGFLRRGYSTRCKKSPLYCYKGLFTCREFLKPL